MRLERANYDVLLAEDARIFGGRHSRRFFPRRER
jgi:hypothetical protein